MTDMNSKTTERLNGLIDEFVETNAPYYRSVFEKMLAAPGYRMTVNWAAAVLGPIWFGARGLWSFAGL